MLAWWLELHHGKTNSLMLSPFKLVRFFRLFFFHFRLLGFFVGTINNDHLIFTNSHFLIKKKLRFASFSIFVPIFQEMTTRKKKKVVMKEKKEKKRCQPVEIISCTSWPSSGKSFSLLFLPLVSKMKYFLFNKKLSNFKDMKKVKKWESSVYTFTFYLSPNILSDRLLPKLQEFI